MNNVPTDNSSELKTISTEPIKENPTTASRTTVEAGSRPGRSTPVQTRKVVLTPPELKVSATAEYVTSRGHEIRIDRDTNGLWFCYFYKGGQSPGCLDGKFGTRRQLHTAIVQYLKSDNVLCSAKWPEFA